MNKQNGGKKMSETNQGRMGYSGNIISSYGHDLSKNESSARQLQEISPNRINPIRKIEVVPEKKIRKGFSMNIGYVIFLMVAVGLMCYALLSYIQLQASINMSTDSISKMERELNNLTLANEEEQVRLMSTVNLDEINLKARQELGMVNPTPDQVINISSARNDYVIQNMAIPSE